MPIYTPPEPLLTRNVPSTVPYAPGPGEQGAAITGTPGAIALAAAQGRIDAYPGQAWITSLPIASPVEASQTLMLRSQPSVATNLPSGENARVWIPPA